MSKNSERRCRARKAQAAISLLIEKFPAAFVRFGERKPLKLGIGLDLQARGIAKGTVAAGLGARPGSTSMAMPPARFPPAKPTTRPGISRRPSSAPSLQRPLEKPRRRPRGRLSPELEERPPRAIARLNQGCPNPTS
jgi:hypothetical protein